MDPTLLSSKKIRHAWLIGVSVIVLSLYAGYATAQSELLKKGKELTESLGEDDQEGLPANEDMAAGLKDALRVGTETVVNQLGQLDGFNADPEIHIPLPESLGKVTSKLEKLGMSSALEDLETRLNRAAEVAVPEAKELFWNAITEMTLEDVKSIFTGEDDAATRYLQSKMSEPLAAKMRPVVDKSLSEVGAIQAFDTVMERYKSIPFVSDVDTDLTGYVVEKGMDGVFFYLAREEAAIRHNPVKRTTDLLKRVFGAD